MGEKAFSSERNSNEEFWPDKKKSGKAAFSSGKRQGVNAQGEGRWVSLEIEKTKNASRRNTIIGAEALGEKIRGTCENRKALKGRNVSISEPYRTRPHRRSDPKSFAALGELG